MLAALIAVLIAAPSNYPEGFPMVPGGVIAPDHLPKVAKEDDHRALATAFTYAMRPELLAEALKNKAADAGWVVESNSDPDPTAALVDRFDVVLEKRRINIWVRRAGDRTLVQFLELSSARSKREELNRLCALGAQVLEQNLGDAEKTMAALAKYAPELHNIESTLLFETMLKTEPVAWPPLLIQHAELELGDKGWVCMKLPHDEPWIQERIRKAKKQRGRQGQSQISEVVAAHREPLLACFQTALKARPDASGEVVVRFTVPVGGGTPVEMKVEKTTLEAPEAAACIMGVLSGLMFPNDSGRRRRVSFPFRFGR